MSPLAGLRVVELARVLAGPTTGQTLADLGADVIKVESPEGDETRRWGPPFIETEGERSAAYFHSCNRGKRSIVADFATERGREIVRRLAARSDVLIENFKVGGLAKFGLDYESFAASTRASSIARSPASARPGLTRNAPATTFLSRACRASWTSPASRTGRRRRRASRSATSLPASTALSPSRRR